MLDIASIAWGSISPRSAASQYNAAASGYSYTRESAPTTEAPRETARARPDVYVAPETKESKDVRGKEPETEKAQTVTSASILLAAAVAYGASNENESEETESTPPPVESTSYETESAPPTSNEPSPATTASVYNTVASASNSTVRGVSVSVII